MNREDKDSSFRTGACIWHEHNAFAIKELNSIWREVLPLGTYEHITKGTKRTDSVWGEDYFSFLDKGMLRLSTVSQTGREKTLLYICNGCIFRELSCVAPYTTTMFSAMEDCDVWNFPRSLLLDETFTVNHPMLMMNLVQSLMQKAGAAFNQQTEHSELSPDAQVCRFLLRSAELTAYNEQPKMTQAEMAQALGLHRSTVCRILHELRQAGIIGQCTKKHFELLDRKALISRCDFFDGGQQAQANNN